VKTRTLTIGSLAVLWIALLPLTALAGHSSTRVYIGGSVWLGPPAYGPAYYGPGWGGPRYYAPPPVYYAPPPVIVQQPPVYVERGDSDSKYWFYCENPRGYHPYVKSCPGGWMRVVPDSVPPGR